jgi:hypothetical protein
MRLAFECTIFRFLGNDVATVRGDFVERLERNRNLATRERIPTIRVSFRGKEAFFGPIFQSRWPFSCCGRQIA